MQACTLFWVTLCHFLNWNHHSCFESEDIHVSICSAAPTLIFIKEGGFVVRVPSHTAGYYGSYRIQSRWKEKKKKLRRIQQIRENRYNKAAHNPSSDRCLNRPTWYPIVIAWEIAVSSRFQLSSIVPSLLHNSIIKLILQGLFCNATPLVLKAVC